MDGLNKKNARDDFSFKNNIIAILMEVKRLFKPRRIKATINGEKYNIIGRLGMYHSIIDVTSNSEIKVGDEVILDIPPLETNDVIRREYI